MASYNKFESWVEYLCGAADVVGSGGTTADMLDAYLSNTTPSASLDSVIADLAEIATGNGYTGPVALNNEGTRSGGTLTVTAESFTVTASGSVGPFQYVVVMDDTVTNDPLVCWFDYGSAVTLAASETFSVLFNSAAVGADGTLFTVA